MIINRNYGLPGFVNEKTLLFVCSYSGNTEETLSAYQEGRARKAKIVTLTSDGKLKDLASQNDLPCLLVPPGQPPRSALGYLFFPALTALSKMGLIEDKAKQIEEAVRLLFKLKDEALGPQITTLNNKAKRLAENLYNKFPLIYTSTGFFETVAARWRAQLAENSKTLSSSHLVPEMNHNEIVGWEFPPQMLGEFAVVMLRDKSEHEKIKKRFEITKSIIKQKAHGLFEVWSQGDGLLARIFFLIYMGDYVSFYLAILNGIDPTPVEKIDYLKKQLTEQES